MPGGKTFFKLESHSTNLMVGKKPIVCCSALTVHRMGPGDLTEDSIEWDPDNGDELGNIMDENQLNKFIRALQMAQQLAHKQEQEKENVTKKPKTYTKNAPRTKRRWRRAREEYQAAGEKLITNWLQRNEACPSVYSQFIVPENELDPDTTSD